MACSVGSVWPGSEDWQMDQHPLPTMRRLATAKDWQCHKELIIRLYKDNDWTLNKVMRFMEEQYGLLAT
jgi:hypothetical protein